MESTKPYFSCSMLHLQNNCIIPVLIEINKVQGRQKKKKKRIVRFNPLNTKITLNKLVSVYGA